ncbi:MAG: hypothetical protein LBK73_03455 [Treponema sp.]|jgi:hypothetical protein|nr:hypothetical protein [Treponema sp.]
MKRPKEERAAHCPLPREELMRLLSGAAGACPRADCAILCAFNRSLKRGEAEKKGA